MYNAEITVNDTVIGVDELEVLHGGLRDASVEVEHIGLRFYAVRKKPNIE